MRQAADALEFDYWQVQAFFDTHGIPVTDLTSRKVEERKKNVGACAINFRMETKTELAENLLPDVCYVEMIL